MDTKSRMKNTYSLESLIFLVIFFGMFIFLGREMGGVNMLNTLMNTAYALLIDTVFYIMAIATMAGAIGGLFTEFGIIAIINSALSRFMKPLFGLPGASIIGALATFLSDNPAILTLADDISFRRYFKKYQIPALTNLGTGFGMGLIIIVFMISIPSLDGKSFLLATMVGLVGAIIGSIVSVRIMLHFTKKIFGTEEEAETSNKESMIAGKRLIRDGNPASRAMDAILEGGKEGVNIGLAIVPGVLIICTLVMMLTAGPSVNGNFTGAAYEGVSLLTKIGVHLDFILKPLLGFNTAQLISVPLTALGAAGAAIGIVPSMVVKGIASHNEIAVFTAMCMCWSGFLSTHVAMMSILKFPELCGKSIFAHTIGGIVAGVSAHYIYVLISLLI